MVSKTGPQPRLGIAYNIKKTGTVLRVAYARTFETPFNENLLLSSATGSGGLAQNVFGSTSVPIAPGFRNQFNVGFQQAIGKFLLIDADYFWKYTHNAYDFSTLLNSTIAFPIAWHNSKLDGVTGRVSTTNLHGFQAYWTFGHTRARYFPPELVQHVLSDGAERNFLVYPIIFLYRHHLELALKRILHRTPQLLGREPTEPENKRLWKSHHLNDLWGDLRPLLNNGYCPELYAYSDIALRRRAMKKTH